MPVSQASLLSSTSAGQSRPSVYSDQELQKIDETASILGCSVDDLLALGTRGHQRPAPTDSQPPPKRLRLSTNLAYMSNREKSPPPGFLSQELTERTPRDGDRENSFSLGIDGSRLAECFASFPVCPPFSSCEPQGMRYLPFFAGFVRRAKLRPRIHARHIYNNLRLWIEAASIR